MQIVLPTPHRKTPVRRTPVSLTALARSTWRRASPRELVFSPLPFTRIVAAWLAIVVVIRANAVIHDAILVPAFGGGAAGIVGTLLTMASVLAVTQPLFRVYAGQWTEVLGWYGFVLATLTVLFETLFALYVEHQFGYEVLASYNVFRGELWPFVVVTVGLTPLIWTRSQS